MKTIIAGGRDITNFYALETAVVKSEYHITTIISGGARGADKLGERYAMQNDIPLVVMKADWEKHGKAAGPIRNVEMANQADALIALWDGKSKGTKHMIEAAKTKGLKVFVWMMKENPHTHEGGGDAAN